MKHIAPILLAITLIVACQKTENPNNIACTAIFGTIGVTVTGDTLTDYFTVRKSNSDTIRFQKQNFPNTNWYQILDDNYHSKLKNKQDQFYFIGLINDSIVVNETYLIKGDDCHINLVSGKTEIQL